MSEKEKGPQFTQSFGYTQNSFWKGPWYSYWTLIVVTLFGGLFGLDHLYLRSPTTAFLKFFVNILGLGIWYFYDIIQIIGEKQSVLKYGLSVPGIGPLGIGAEMFLDDHPDAVPAKSPFRYLFYMFLLLLPFGFDHVVAGDVYGGLAKFLTTFIPLLWPIGIIWSLVNWGRATFAPKHLFEKGTYRIFPFNIFMSTYGPSKLGPVDLPSYGEAIYGFFGWIFTTFGKIFETIGDAVAKFLGLLIKPLLKFLEATIFPIIATALKGITAAILPPVAAASRAVEVGAKAVEKVAETAEVFSSEVKKQVPKIVPAVTGATMAIGSEVKKTAKALGPSVKNVVSDFGDIASDSTSLVANTVHSGKEIGEQLAQNAKEGTEFAENLVHPTSTPFNGVTSAAKDLTKRLNVLGTPEGLKALATTTAPVVSAVAAMNASPQIPSPLPNPASINPLVQTVTNKQVGGGSTDDFSLASAALFMLFVVVLGGATYIAVKRLNNDKPFFQKEDDKGSNGSKGSKGSKRNDAPPKP